MTDWSFKYPTLGFDPLPGDPAIVLSLKEDARIFGLRMTEESKRLELLTRREGWQGEAADTFAEHLKTLPRDLKECGRAFSNLALSLGSYHELFKTAKCQLDDLETKAAAAKQQVQAADLAYNAPVIPVIQAPGDCPPFRDRETLNTAEEELGEILRDAHDFADKFDNSPEIEALARAIRECAKYAPDEPRWNGIKKWAGDAFKLTPIGAAVNAVHSLINEYAEFFNDLASVLSDISGTLGILSLPLLFLPPMGTAAAILALSAAAGSSAIKTSLYAGDARDANGNRYVSGGNLIRSYVDLGMNAAGVAGGAAASRAAKLAKGKGTTLGKELADQFSAKTFSDSLDAPEAALRLIKRDGVANASGEILGGTIKTFKTTHPGHLFNTGGVALTGFAPLTTALAPNNFFGWQSAYSLKSDIPSLLSDPPGQPDLQVRVEPVLRAVDTTAPGSTDAPEPRIEPVMKD